MGQTLLEDYGLGSLLGKAVGVDKIMEYYSYNNWAMAVLTDSLLQEAAPCFCNF